MIDNDLTPEQRAELGDLHPLYNALNTHAVPEPDSARLLATLEPLLQAEQIERKRRLNTAEIVPIPAHRKLGEWLRLAWLQTELLEAPFWASSILLTLMGLLWGSIQGSAGTTLYLLFLSPLVAMSGIAYLFRPATRTLWELERLSRYQPFELLYARVAVIGLLNVVLAMTLLLLGATQGFQMVLWRLLLIWLGPLVGLMGLGLFCSVRWGTLAGIVMPTTVWGAMIVLGWRDTIFNMPFNAIHLNALVGQIALSNTLPLFAASALIGGLFLIYQSGRQVTRWG